MKHVSYVSLTGLLCATLTLAGRENNGLPINHDYAIQIEPLWHSLETDTSKNILFGGTWVLAGSVTFKKKAKDLVRLQSIHLQWKGPHVENLMGSLYKKESDKDFLPIEENLVCDSLWNKSKQTMVFNFPKRQALGISQVFYIVLTIPLDLEPIISSGHFIIDRYMLPDAFKECFPIQELSYEASQSCKNTIHVATR